MLSTERRTISSLPRAALRGFLAAMMLLAALPGRGEVPLVSGPRGFQAPWGAAIEREQRLATTPDADRLRALAQQLGGEARVAGTPAAARAAGKIADRMTSWGLDVKVHEYNVLLPHARAARVDRLTPAPLTLTLDEEPLTDDPDSDASRYPAVAAYSAAGNVEAGVVYANYGTTADFTALRALNADVTGKIVVMRYGNVFRGAKVRNAEAAGAAAVLLYSDPFDDGYYRGDVYPRGPYRPWTGVQRGSVRTGPPGDPNTPGLPATVGAAAAAQQVPATPLPSIPVVALSYASAAELLQHLEGAEAPSGWQGALPFRYHVGLGGVRARVWVELDDAPMRRIRNVVGTLRGRERPDEWVILGAHYDSWTAGAMDNLSGTVALLESARVLAELSAAGWPPRRSILFAAWDAEEWGLIGSTEWTEAYADQLRDSAVAYINLDGVVGGPYFSATASPSLRTLIRDTSKVVADPTLPTTTVYDSWRRRAAMLPSGEPRVSLPAGGSDDAPFFAVLGVPTMSFGFSGSSGVYHSAYDTNTFVERFGDPGYRQHRAVAALAAVLGWRLASADVLPLDYRDQAAELATALSNVDAALAGPGANARTAGTELVWRALGRLAAAAGELEAHTRLTLQKNSVGRIAAGLQPVNDHLLRVERAFTRAGGLAARPWFNNLVYAPSDGDLYASELLPGVQRALRDGDGAALAVELDDLATSMRTATVELVAAATSLRAAADSRVAGTPPASRDALQ